jgi:hypothetical protein
MKEAFLILFSEIKPERSEVFYRNEELKGSHLAAYSAISDRC